MADGGVEAAPPRRVAHDGDRAGGYGHRGEHRQQDSGGCQSHQQQVAAERPAEIFADDPPDGAASMTASATAPPPPWTRVMTAAIAAGK